MRAHHGGDHYPQPQAKNRTHGPARSSTFATSGCTTARGDTTHTARQRATNRRSNFGVARYVANNATRIRSQWGCISIRKSRDTIARAKRYVANNAIRIRNHDGVSTGKSRDAIARAKRYNTNNAIRIRSGHGGVSTDKSRDAIACTKRNRGTIAIRIRNHGGVSIRESRDTIARIGKRCRGVSIRESRHAITRARTRGFGTTCARCVDHVQSAPPRRHSRWRAHDPFLCCYREHIAIHHC